MIRSKNFTTKLSKTRCKKCGRKPDFRYKFLVSMPTIYTDITKFISNCKKSNSYGILLQNFSYDSPSNFNSIQYFSYILRNSIKPSYFIGNYDKNNMPPNCNYIAYCICGGQDWYIGKCNIDNLKTESVLSKNYKTKY